MPSTVNIVSNEEKVNSKNAGKAHIQFLKPSETCPLSFPTILVYSALANKPGSSLRDISILTMLDRHTTTRNALKDLSDLALVEHKNNSYIALEPHSEQLAWFRQKSTGNGRWQSQFYYLSIYFTCLDLGIRQLAVYWAIHDYPGQKAIYYANGLNLSRQNVYKSLYGWKWAKGENAGLLKRQLANDADGRLYAPALAEENLIAAKTETTIIQDWLLAQMPVDREWGVFWDQKGFLKAIKEVTEEFLATGHYNAKNINEYWRWLFKKVKPEWVEFIVHVTWRKRLLITHIATNQKWPGNKFLMGATERIIDHIKQIVANNPAGSVSPVTCSLPDDLFNKTWKK